MSLDQRKVKDQRNGNINLFNPLKGTQLRMKIVEAMRVYTGEKWVGKCRQCMEGTFMEALF